MHLGSSPSCKNSCSDLMGAALSLESLQGLATCQAQAQRHPLQLSSGLSRLKTFCPLIALVLLDRSQYILVG